MTETLYEQAQAIKENRDDFAKTIKKIINAFYKQVPDIRTEIPPKVQQDILQNTQMRCYQVEYPDVQIFPTCKVELASLDDLPKICKFLFDKRNDKRCQRFTSMDNSYHFDYVVPYSDDGKFYDETDNYHLQCKKADYEDKYQLFVSTYLSADDVTKLLAHQGFTTSKIENGYRVVW